MCVGYFLVLLDVTIVNVALPTMARGLHATVTDLQWVVDGYAIASWDAGYGDPNSPTWKLTRCKPARGTGLLSTYSAKAAAFAWLSFLIGICAAMPPIAKAPRRWQVRTSSDA